MLSSSVLKVSVLTTLIWCLLSAAEAALLGGNCKQNSDCNAKLSECNVHHEICTCKPYSVEANSTTCLPGSLLGFSCETDAQCRIKVPTSGCVNGVCACGDGYVAYRRHTCLAPSKLGDVCFENEQCTLADKASYCKFVVPKVFGRCQCQVGKEFSDIMHKCVGTNTRELSSFFTLTLITNATAGILFYFIFSDDDLVKRPYSVEKDKSDCKSHSI
ncbi:unnamed protein product [Allacma fusca]|uniref:EB domain-containing protein n=1 Tax=Allacma fusca TaxID=39272 RepID=A0A8J2PMI3_9HEXA|nr:unnamed protein product [Allacma fusca]